MNKNAKVATVGNVHIFYPDVANGRHEIARLFIEHIAGNGRIAVGADLYILHEDILNDAAAGGTCFEAKHPIEVGTVHCAIDGINIFSPTGYFTTNHYAA